MKSDLINSLQQLTDQNLEDLKRAKADGRALIGFYCLFSPAEIAVAAGAVPLPLCGTRNDPIAAAEEILPRNLCPLIKSSFGFAVTDTCPFFRVSDIIIGDTTCDGKKKMFQLLQDMVRAFAVDGVVDLTWQACHTYNVEAYRVNELIQDNFGFPTLHLETDYAESDTEQLRVRIEAYLEML